MKADMTFELKSSDLRAIERATEASLLAVRWRQISAVLDLVVMAAVLADWVLR